MDSPIVLFGAGTLAGCLFTWLLLAKKGCEETPKVKETPKEDKKTPREEKKAAKGKETLQEDKIKFEEEEDEFKLVLAARMDLKMGPGKIAAQCSHATLGAYRQAEKSYPNSLRKCWTRYGQAKVVVKCPDEDVMDALIAVAEETGVPYYVVADAGRTQIAAGSRTVLAVGPAPKKLVDQVTGSLKLY